MKGFEMSKMCTAAGFSTTNGVTKFHVTDSKNGFRDFSVSVPGRTLFEFVSLPKAMTKAEAAAFVINLPGVYGDSKKLDLLKKYTEVKAASASPIANNAVDKLPEVEAMAKPVVAGLNPDEIKARNLAKIKEVAAKRNVEVVNTDSGIPDFLKR
jgi:hypothetical protein